MAKIDVTSLATSLLLLGSAFTSYAVRCALVTPNPSSRIEGIEGFLCAGAYMEVLDVLKPPDTMVSSQLEHHDVDTKCVCYVLDHVHSSKQHIMLANTRHLGVLTAHVAQKGQAEAESMFRLFWTAEDWNSCLEIVTTLRKLFPAHPACGGEVDADDRWSALRLFASAVGLDGAQDFV